MKYIKLQLEFKAVMVLPEITVITVTVIMLAMHLVGKVINPKTKKNWECTARGSVNIV